MSSTPFKDSKLRRELMEKLNLNDNDIAPKKSEEKPAKDISKTSDDNINAKTIPNTGMV